MKKLIAMALLTVGMTAQAQTSVDPYKPVMDAYDRQANEIMAQFKELQKNDPNGEKPESKERAKVLSDRLDSISEAQFRLIKEIIRDNRDNDIPVPYIKDAMYQFTYEELKEALDPKASYYSHPDLAQPKMLLAGLEKRKPGIQFHELTMKDTEGNDVSLSQWVGKGNYVLVDFWASWCGPCRREMPNVIACYEKYHDKGFDVVGVSFDQKKEAWLSGIEALGMPWHQMSDLKGWGCAASEIYGVRSIPSNVLVDPTGKIVAMDLRAEKLANTLKEIYGE